MPTPAEILRAKVEYANKYMFEHIDYANHDHKEFYRSFAALELERPGALTDVSIAHLTATGRHILEQECSAWTPEFFESLGTPMKDFADGPQTVAYLLHWRFKHPKKAGEDHSAYYAGSSKQAVLRIDIHNTWCKEDHNENHIYARVRESAVERRPTAIKMAEVKAIENEDSLIEHLEHLIVVIMDLAHTCSFREATEGIRGSQNGFINVNHDAFEGTNRQDPIRQNIPRSDKQYEECRHCSCPILRTAYVEHLRDQHKDYRGMYACTQCKSEPTTPSGLKKHLVWHYPHDERPFGCEECPQKFVNRGGLLSHHCQRHATDEERVFKCPITDCTAAFSYEPRQKAHIKSGHAIVETCPVEGCGALITQLHMSEHIKTKHPTPDAPKFICGFDGCETDCKTAILLKKHMKQCPVGVPKVRCEYCTKSVVNHCMKGHLSSWHPLCPVCNKRITVTMSKVAEREGQLKAHIKCCSTNIDGSKRVRDVDSDGEKENKRPAKA